MRNFIKNFWEAILVIIVFGVLSLFYPEFSITLIGSWAWALVSIISFIALVFAVMFVKLMYQYFNSIAESIKERNETNGHSD